MSSRFSILFTDPKRQLDPLPLNFRVLSHGLAQRWGKILAQTIELGHQIVDGGRFSNFEVDPALELKNLGESLRACVKTLNCEGQAGIPELASGDLTQEQLNYLHKYFEVARGESQEPPESFKRLSQNVQVAWCEFNGLIHDIESAYELKKEVPSRARVSLGFWDSLREPLVDEDYGHFTLKRRFGQIYLIYYLVGKTLLDAYFDGDQVVSDEAVRPLDTLTPAAFFYFGKNHTLQLDEDFYSWLRARGLNSQDPKLAIGWLPVGEIEFQGDGDSLRRELALRQQILDLRVIE